MLSSETMACCLAEDPRANSARANKSESDRELREEVSESGASMGSAQKICSINSIYVILLLCAAKVKEDMKGLKICIRSQRELP